MEFLRNRIFCYKYALLRKHILFLVELSEELNELKKMPKHQDQPVMSKHEGRDSTLTDEEIEILLKSQRSVAGILKWAGTLKFERCDDGIRCQVCQTTISYDFNDGEDFTAQEDILPLTFRHLKFDLIRHSKTSTHIENLKRVNKLNLIEKQEYDTGKQAAINCASAAYLTYKLESSYRDYETIIAEFYNSGGVVGLKNHSKEFARNFLPHVYLTLSKEICNFIISNDLPFGIIADKMTANRRSRHIIGLRVPILDINSKYLFQSIYLEHNPATDLTGNGLAMHILQTLEKFGLDLSYIRNHLVGLAVDGQYIIQDVGKHLENKLMKSILVSWDPMHRIELSKKHADTPKIVAEAFDLVHDAMKNFSSGKSFEVLLKCSEQFSGFFYRPKLFKTMKFSAHCETVFHTFLADYQTLISACEQDPDGFVLRDKLMNKLTMINILSVADICSALGKTSKKVQETDNMPWEYTSHIKSLISSFEIMKTYFEELSIVASEKENQKVEKNTQFAAALAKLPKTMFLNLKTALEMFPPSNSGISSTYHGVPLPETSIGSKNLRSQHKVSEWDELRDNFLCLSSYVKMLIGQLNVYFSKTESGDKPSMFAIIDKSHLLLNYEFLIYPNPNVSIDEAKENRGLTEESFSDILKVFPFVESSMDLKTLWFQYQIFNKWMCDKIYETVIEGDAPDIKHLFKIALHELKEKLPTFLQLFLFIISMPVSEAVCETWGSVIDVVGKHRLRSKDGTDEEVGTNDKRVFIQLNGPPSGYKGTRRFLKAALLSMYGSAYPSHFRNPTRSEMMKRYITSKVISKINENASCLPCFK